MDPGRSNPSGDRRCVAALAVLVALVAVARAVGLGFQLPMSGIADERVYVQHIGAFRSGAADTAILPEAATYPYLVSKVALATSSAPHCDSADVADHLATATAVPIHLRRVVAAFSLLSIPAMWLLVRAFASSATALLAAALVATSVFVQVLAQQGRPHGAFLGLSLTTIALSVRLLQRPGFARMVPAAVAAALSLTALQSGVALLAPVSVAILLARGVALRTRVVWLTVAYAIAGLAFFWAYHYLFVEHIDRSTQPGHALLGEGVFGLEMLNGDGFHAMGRGLWTYEPFGVVVAAVAGAVALVLFARRASKSAAARGRVLDPRTWSDTTRASAVVASFVAPYVILFGLYEHTYTRYALPLVPFVAWLVAWALTPRGSWSTRPAAWIPAALVVVAQGALVAKLAYVRAQPDTSELAARWLALETPADARVGIVPNDDVPLLRRADQREALRKHAANDPHHHWLAYQAHLGAGPWDANARDVLTLWGVPPDRMVDEYAAAGTQYFVMRTVQLYQTGGIALLRAGLERRGRVVATFAPIESPTREPFPAREEFSSDKGREPWLVQLVRARRTGNVVEVWKLDR